MIKNPNYFPCPFCGSTAIVAMTIQEHAEMSNGTPDHDDGYFVYCDATEGGCGASSGFVPKLIECVPVWNRRTGMQRTTLIKG